MAEKILSINSSASEILNKVTKALEANKPEPQEEDVLELFEEIRNDKNSSEDVTAKNLDVQFVCDKPEEESQPIEKKASQIATEKPSGNINKDDEGIKMKDKLVSEATAKTTSALLKKLKDSATTKPVSDGLHFDSGTTVEHMVAELIKPYLSNWLDKHLSAIVKNVVEKEVKKLMPSED